MSDNEIKPVAWVERNENGHDRMWSYSLESWVHRPANPEPLYDQSAIDALTNQISELKTMLSIAEFQRKEMQAERDAAVAQRNGYIDQHRRDSAELRAVCAERDAAVADAERYRWLRSSSQNKIDSYPVVVDSTPCCAPCLFGEKLDAAIDAARAEGGV